MMVTKTEALEECLAVLRQEHDLQAGSADEQRAATRLGAIQKARTALAQPAGPDVRGDLEKDADDLALILKRVIEHARAVHEDECEYIRKCHGTPSGEPSTDILAAEAALAEYHSRREARTALSAPDGWRGGAPPTDGRIYEALCKTVMKWKPYKKGAPPDLRELGGRWQESNGFGGFDNTDAVPVFHRPIQPPKGGE